MSTRTAVCMYSGGLDSALAICVMRDLGIRPIAFHLVSAYCQCTPSGSVSPHIEEGAEELGVELHTFDANRDLTQMVLAPAHGFGKHLNPCIDCRINTIRRADEFRQSIGADFLVTGEVIGQRPKSQNRNAMALVERQCGCADLLVRALCAPALSTTLPEREGWIDRSKMPHIQGRGRHQQLAMAKDYGITKFGSPAGGCLLTESNYCKRLTALFKRNGLDIRRGKKAAPLSPDEDKAVSTTDLLLLRTGRHFFGADGDYYISSKDYDGNLCLEHLAEPGDILIQSTPVHGSVTLIRRPNAQVQSLLRPWLKNQSPPPESAFSRLRDAKAIQEACGLSVFYSKNRQAAKSHALLTVVTSSENEKPEIELMDMPVIPADQFTNLSQ